MSPESHPPTDTSPATGGSGNPPAAADRPARRTPILIGLLVLVALATFGVTMLLVTIFEHRQEARQPFVRIVEVDEVTTDPRPWGKNWPHQFDSYLRTVDTDRTEHGGSSAMPESKLEAYPWLKRLYAGYAFALDYREARGHAYMLYDQEVTRRVTERTQSGACLHCHASVVPTYRRLGMIAQGQSPTTEDLKGEFDWPAVIKGFEQASTMTYSEMYAELLKTPDGTPDNNEPLFPGGQPTERENLAVDEALEGEGDGGVDPHHLGQAHPVSCIDCHDPEDMSLRITRPGFLQGIQDLAESDEPVPHMPSVERWREGDRDEPYDPNVLATRQEMRSFTCGQCHVEYYCADKKTLTFPWGNGLKVEQIEQFWDEAKFRDGSDFYDWKHGETGAKLYKAQHPEFELWSQGIHAQAGVSCADCHMPYERKGAMKVSSHWVHSPMLNVSAACQTCHSVPEDELKRRVETIQSRTMAQMDRAAKAMEDMLDAIRAAQAAGATEEQLQPLFALQRKAMWRLDYISSENSKGFHADQEATRILGESIDYSRQAQAQAIQLRAEAAPDTEHLPREPIRGVTSGDAPPSPDDGEQ